MRTIYRFIFNKFRRFALIAMCNTFHFQIHMENDKKVTNQGWWVIAFVDAILLIKYWKTEQNFILDGNLNVKLLFFFFVFFISFHVPYFPFPTYTHNAHTQLNECQTNDKTFNWNFKITCRSIFHSCVWPYCIYDTRECRSAEKVAGTVYAMHIIVLNRIIYLTRKIKLTFSRCRFLFLLSSSIYFFLERMYFNCNSWNSHMKWNRKGSWSLRKVLNEKRKFEKKDTQQQNNQKCFESVTWIMSFISIQKW